MIKGLEHIALSVADLDRSIKFYCNALRLEVLAKVTFEGEQYERIMELKGATGRAAMLAGRNIKIELFEFAYPVPPKVEVKRPVCNHGITHFCVAVDDIEVEYERLKASGVEFTCFPVGFGGSCKATYARDPDGNVFELLQG